MILKTYSRIFTGDMDLSLRFLEHLTGQKPDYRFRLPEMGIEVSGLADFCVVAGSKEKLDPLRGSQGPLIVDDLSASREISHWGRCRHHEAKPGNRDGPKSLCPPP